MFPGRAAVPTSGRAAMLPGALSCLVGSANPKKILSSGDRNDGMPGQKRLFFYRYLCMGCCSAT